MPYTLQWYIENEILYMHTSQISVVELRACLRELQDYMAQSERPLVHALIDVSRLVRPLSLIEMAQSIQGFRPPKNIGWMITIGEQDSVVKFATTVANQFLKVRQRSFKTVDEAISFLRDMDTTVHWDKADHAVLGASKDG